MTAQQQDETTPLLSASASASAPNASGSITTTSRDDQESQHDTHRSPQDTHASSTTIQQWLAVLHLPWVHVVALIIFIALIFNTGAEMFLASRFRLFESILCSEYYSSRQPDPIAGVMKGPNIPEAMCKVDEVQDELASLLGWQQFWESIPAIFLSIPYGYLADRYGRRYLLVVSLAGCTAAAAFAVFAATRESLPLSYTWLSAMFHAAGGGPTMATTYVLMMLADVTPPDLRSTIFSIIGCAGEIASFITPILTSILINQSFWIPILTGVGCCALATLLSLVLPETLMRKDVPIMDDATIDADGLITEPSIWERCRAWYREAQDGLAVIFKDPALVALILIFFVFRIGLRVTEMTAQFASKKLSWPYSKALYLVSVYSAVTFSVFTFIVPLSAKWVLHRYAGGVVMLRDRWIMQASFLILVAGTTIIFFAGGEVLLVIGLVVMGLGIGAPVMARSLATSLVQVDTGVSGGDIGMLMAVINITLGISTLVGGPAMAWAFHLGMSWGENWLGFPYLVAAILYALSWLIIFLAPARVVAEV